MNEARREQIRQAQTKLGEAKTLLECARDDEREAKENMPESLQEGETGQQMEQNADALDEACNTIETLESELEDLCN